MGEHNNDNDFLTITQLSELINIPHQTIRRYIDKHGHHLITKKRHKSILISRDSIKTLEQIRSLYGDKKTAEEIDERLSAQGVTMTITVPDEHENVMRVDVREILLQQQEDIKQLSEKLNEQLKFNHQLKEINAQMLEEMRKMQEYQGKRDVDLFSSLKELKKSEEEIASTKEKRWISKLFRK